MYLFLILTVPYIGTYYGEKEKHNWEHDQSKNMSLIKSIKIFITILNLFIYYYYLLLFI